MVVLVTSTMCAGPVARWVSGGTEPKLLAKPMPSNPLIMPRASLAGERGASMPEGRASARAPARAGARLPSRCRRGWSPRGAIMRGAGSSDCAPAAGAAPASQPAASAAARTARARRIGRRPAQKRSAFLPIRRTFAEKRFRADLAMTRRASSSSPAVQANIAELPKGEQDNAAGASRRASSPARGTAAGFAESLYRHVSLCGRVFTPKAAQGLFAFARFTALRRQAFSCGMSVALRFMRSVSAQRIARIRALCMSAAAAGKTASDEMTPIRYNNMPSIDHAKELAARASLDFLEDGIVVGLGSGSTAACFIRLLGERVRRGLKVRAIPSSRSSRELAEALGIPLVDLRRCPEIDVAIDGADQIAPGLALIKGGGGALLHEKIVASAAARFIVIADYGKVAARLGGVALPVEVIPAACPLVARKLAR